MRLDCSLNLVLKIEREGAPDVHLHMTPVSRSVFDANYALIARTEADIFARGTAYMLRAGPRIAAMTLKDVGKREAQDHGVEGDSGASALLMEIKRLTSVIGAGKNGWETLPVDVAMQRGILGADEWSEAENTACFFTLISCMAPIAAAAKMQTMAASLIGAQAVSSSSTEFAASLPTSMQDVPIPKTTSQVPS